ncbi:head closure Hc1 [Mycobacterium phage Phlei]|uniref:Head-to-tail stopper n=1 Tax=Mycobacterium phage Phlei TaxID=1690684 RepID=A0A0N9BDQ0_9CAUD|nr:head closure Hc1 [Mycobacterium phage Phlei]ALA48128.1 hypothetical protein [Mycobacterium phage Phlei]
MSLLDHGARYDDVIVYPEETITDEDGNTFTRPSKTGIPAKARFQIMNQSGTSARRAEQDNEGFLTEKIYRMRFPRSFTAEHGILGAQSIIIWNGEKWSVFGDVTRWGDSHRTARVDYTVKRA